MGTSPFTHNDDALTPIHTSAADHHDALHYGGEVPPKNELAEIILGPPAYGSPDPRTLGHRMHPLEDRPASAPNLDLGFEALQGRSSGEVVTADDLNSMSKAEIKDLVDQAGLDAPSDATKSDLIDILTGADDSESS